MSPPPILPLGGITGTQAIVLTASQLSAIIKPIVSLTKTITIGAAKGTFSAAKGAGGSVRRAAVAQGFDRKGTVSKAFDDTPIANMAGDVTADMFNWMKGGSKEEKAKAAEAEVKRVEAERARLFAEQKERAEFAQARDDFNQMLIRVHTIADNTDSMTKLLAWIHDSTLMTAMWTERISEDLLTEEAYNQRGRAIESAQTYASLESIEKEREDDRFQNALLAAVSGGPLQGGFQGPIQQQATPEPGIISKMMGGVAKFFDGKWMTKLFSVLGTVFTGIISMAKAIPGLVKTAMPWLKSGGKFFLKIFGRIFMPIYALFNFITGFIDGFKEGGLEEGFVQGFEKVIKNIFEVPLNLMKDIVAWVAGALGFEEFEKTLNDFGPIDITQYVRPIIEWFADIPDKIKDLMFSIADSLPNVLGFDMGAKFLDVLGLDKAEEMEKRKEKKKTKAAKKPEVSKTSKEEKPEKKVAKASVPTPKRSKEVSSSDISYKELSNDGELPWWDWIEKFPNFPGEIPSEQWLEAGYRATDRGPHHLSDWGKIADHARQYMKPMSGFMIKKNAKKFGRSPEEHAKIIGQSENLSMNVGGSQSTGAATQIQDAGLEKGATAGAAPVVINNSPVNNNVQNSQSTSAVLAGARNMDSDPSLNVNP